MVSVIANGAWYLGDGPSSFSTNSLPAAGEFDNSRWWLFAVSQCSRRVTVPVAINTGEHTAVAKVKTLQTRTTRFRSEASIHAKIRGTGGAQPTDLPEYVLCYGAYRKASRQSPRRHY